MRAVPTHLPSWMDQELMALGSRFESLDLHWVELLPQSDFPIDHNPKPFQPDRIVDYSLRSTLRLPHRCSLLWNNLFALGLTLDTEEKQVLGSAQQPSSSLRVQKEWRDWFGYQLGLLHHMGIRILRDQNWWWKNPKWWEALDLEQPQDKSFSYPHWE